MEISGPGQSPGNTSAENLETLPEHSMIGEFEITGIIGEGGFGTVYLATDHSLQRTVALKEYRPAALATRQGQSVVVRSQRHAEAFEAGLKSFLNEARTLARFDHPALIRVYRVWQENNTAYMAMPLCEGRPLTSIVRENPETITEPWLKAMLALLLEAVETLHSVDIFHRDIAPDNVMIQENGAPVLLDFGAARHIATGATQALTVIIKPGYAPIEQFAEDASMKQGPWTDIYALGAVMYFCVTGRPPPNSVARLINDPLKPLATTVTQGFSQEFLRAIDATLAVRPEARPQNIAELRALLGLPAFTPAPRTQMHAGRPGAATATTVTMLKPRSAPNPAPAGASSAESPATVMIPRKTAAPAPAAVSASPRPETQPAATPAAPAPETLADASPGKPAGSRKGLWMFAAVAGVAVVGVAAMLMRTQSEAPPPAASSPGADSARSAPAATPPTDATANVAVLPAAGTAAAAAPKPAGEAQPAAPAVPAVPASSATTSPAPSAQPPGGPPVPDGTPAMGTVRIAIKPWGEVFVNGVSKGVSPPLKQLSLPEGKHRVEITNPGFTAYSAEIEVAKNQSVTVSYQFK